MVCPATGVPVCTPGQFILPDGSSCGTDKVCLDGSCVACAANQTCTPTAGACVRGLTACTTGVQVCTAMGPVDPGVSCGSNQVCDGAGACVACQGGVACTPTNTCHAGAISCATGSPVCTDTTVALADNVYCADDKLCTAGSCGDAGNWITRGEDDRTFTGGFVFTYQADGATIVPLTSLTAPFIPASGGMTGKALSVSGSIPPQNPAQDVWPISALGFTLNDDATSYNAAARGSGIKFYARSVTPVTLVVGIEDIWTDPAYPNCTMASSPSAVHVCFNRAEASCAVPGGNVWTACAFVWNSFVREDWGNLGAGMSVDEQAITQVHIRPPPTPSGSSGQSFQFSIDDVSYL
jgi:hypothetical protein